MVNYYFINNIHKMKKKNPLPYNYITIIVWPNTQY